MLSKDAFWNSENVTVYDSFISGEYLGWNAKNLTFINCTIESNQGMCYIDNLVMKNCRLLNTTLAFEYSTVDAEVNNTTGSVLNPTAGRIQAKEIKELVMDAPMVDVTKTIIQIQELSMWVADMDFETAPEITEALKKRVEHGISGYTLVPETWKAAVTGWWERRHDFKMEKDWMIFCTGVIPAISSVVLKLTTAGENVLIQTPVYNIFFNSIRNNDGCGGGTE